MSKTYCSNLWDHQHIHMSGNFRFCCVTNKNVPDSKGNFYHINNTSLENVWNSQHIRDTRLKMIRGESIPECERCVKQESRGYASMRSLVNKEKNFDKTDDQGRVSIMPNTMELHYGNLCNLKCRMCSQNYSNQIGNELLEIGKEDKKFLAWVMQQSANVNNWTNNLSIEYTWFQNKRIKNKLHDFISKNIEHLRVIGGEPTIISEFYELFDYCNTQNTLKNKSFSIVTNLTNTNLRMLERLPKLKEWKIIASIDGINERNEYIRYPSNFKKIIENLETYKSLLKNNNNGAICFNPAIQLLNIDHLDTMLEWFLNFAEEMFEERIFMNWVAQVWYPKICNYDIAPSDYRFKVADKLEKKVSMFKSYKSIGPFFENQIKNLRQNTLDKNTEIYLQKCFIKYNDRLDKHRGRTTWRKLLPDLETALTKSVG